MWKREEMPPDDFFWPMGLDTEGHDEENKEEEGARATTGPCARPEDEASAVILNVLLAQRGGPRVAFAVSEYYETLAQMARRWAMAQATAEALKTKVVVTPTKQMRFTWHEG